MLEFYVNKNGELMSGKDKDIVVQTSKGVDTILVHLPEDYNDNNIVASITFKNPKNVKSNQYVMQHVDGSKQLSYLLDDAWFSYVKGTMEFTIRVYSTDTTMKDFVEIDDNTGDIIADEQSKKQVFTKGSYVILEAVEVGSTPEIPEDELEKLFNEITKRTTQSEVYAYVEKVTGISQSEVEDKEFPYENIDSRLSIVEQELQDESGVIEIAERVYNEKDKTIDILPSENPMQIKSVNSIDGEKVIDINLPSNSISVDYYEQTNTPIMQVNDSLLLNGKQESELNVDSALNYVDINNNKQNIYNSINELNIKINLFNQTLENVSNQTSSNSVEVSNVNQTISSLQNNLATVQNNINKLLTTSTTFDVEISRGTFKVGTYRLNYGLNSICIYNDGTIDVINCNIKDDNAIVTNLGSSSYSATIKYKYNALGNSI